MKKKILITLLCAVVPIIMFVILIYVIQGSIGNKEEWRILCSAIGFLITLIVSILIMHKLLIVNLYKD